MAMLRPITSPLATRRSSAIHCHHRRVFAFAPSPSARAHAATRGVRAMSGMGMFNPEFSAALAGAMQRNGEDVLTASSTPAEPPICTQEEMLAAAVTTSQLNLRQLSLVKRELEAALAREEKQYHRLRLALEAVRKDAAYYRTLDTMLNNSDDER